MTKWELDTKHFPILRKSHYRKYIYGSCNDCGCISNYLTKKSRQCPSCRDPLFPEKNITLFLFRKKVHIRDKFQCQICGIYSKQIHHILFKCHYSKLKRNYNNGIILCNTHENEAHGRRLDNRRHLEIPILVDVLNF